MDRFRDVLRRHDGRLTRERVALLQIICDREGHFRPEEILQELRRQRYRVSLTTIYRNLALLIEADIIRRASVFEDQDRTGVRYERVWGREHHDHLVCSGCGKMVEFSYPAIDLLQEAAAREHGFRLKRHHLELVGLCPTCQALGGEGT